jgi:Fe-Mn family superoxide dismutase
MKYELPSLPYSYNALEPYISAQIMEIHHAKHHKGYVDGANAALEKLLKAREGAEVDVKAILKEYSFNLGGHILHTLFWQNMKPNGGGEPGGELLDEINKVFGSFSVFKKLFTQAAVSVEGSGWAMLVYDELRDSLSIIQVEKHNLNVVPGLIPLLVIDVWEHAYYLQYQNQRAKFVDAWWNVVNWSDVEKRFAKAKSQARDLI